MDNDDVLKVSVDYDRSVTDGIKGGRYDWFDPNITDAHFPNTRSVTSSLEVYIVEYGKCMSAKNVLANLDKRNLRPATLQELLAVGEQYPDLQREFPIVALGSVWQNAEGNRCVPCIVGGGSSRGLRLHWIGGDWGGLCRFAAVRR